MQLPGTALETSGDRIRACPRCLEALSAPLVWPRRRTTISTARLVWIELGGQFDILWTTISRSWRRRSSRTSPKQLVSPRRWCSKSRLLYMASSEERQKRSASILEATADWVFFASVRYGRSSSNGYRHQQTNQPVDIGFFQTRTHPSRGKVSVCADHDQQHRNA